MWCEFYRATLGGHSGGLLSYVSPNQSVRRESGASRNAEGANSARKRSGTRTADGGTARFRGASGERWIGSPPTEGERRLQRLISQVTGQKGGRRRGTTATRACRLFLLGGSVGKTHPAVQAAPGAGRPHRRLRRLGHAGAVQLADR